MTDAQKIELLARFGTLKQEHREAFVAYMARLEGGMPIYDVLVQMHQDMGMDKAAAFARADEIMSQVPQ